MSSVESNRFQTKKKKVTGSFLLEGRCRDERFQQKLLKVRNDIFAGVEKLRGDSAMSRSDVICQTEEEASSRVRDVGCQTMPEDRRSSLRRSKRFAI